MSGFRYTFLGLSITSSWGNGHATTYRALTKALAAQGHDVTFLERDQPFYAANRDAPSLPYVRTLLYRSLDELRDRFGALVRESDLVVVGSYVPEGIQVGAWACDLAPNRTAFYDIDTPVTLGRLASRSCEYLSPELVPRYALYLSFTGGPTLRLLETRWGSPNARPLYCSVDPELYYPEVRPARWDLGYLGTYSADRQDVLEALLVEPARRWRGGRFIVAGPQYPAGLLWPENVDRETHVAPDGHRGFYNEQRFTLNVTRRAMREAGFSPSVRLFEAAACGTPIVSDAWPGLDTFLLPGREILVAGDAAEVDRILRRMPERDRDALAGAARTRVLREHTAGHRAETLARYTRELLEHDARRHRATPAVPTHAHLPRGET